MGLTADYFHPQNVGGAERSALELAKALVKKGNEVIVYTRYVKGIPVEESIDGIIVKRIFRTLSRYTVRSDVIDQEKVDSKEKNVLRNAAEEDSVEILHSQNRDTATFTALAGKEMNVPVFVHVRDYWPICPKRDLLRKDGICPGPENCASCMSEFYGSILKRPFYRRLERDTEYRGKILKENTPFYIHISDFSRKLLNLEPSARIYNPIDISLFKNKGENGGALYIGSLTKHKGVRILVDAAKDAGMELHLIGDGPLRKELEGKAILHGKLEYSEMIEELANAEMLIVPSIWNEPFGRVVVEGMAAGKPVIVSPYGALPEIGGDAVMIAEPTVKGLSGAMKKVHSDESLRKEMGALGRKRAEMFRPERIAEEVVELYRRTRT